MTTSAFSIPSPRHYILLTAASWGHARPEITLALRLIRLHPHLHITALVPDVVSERITKLISNGPPLTSDEKVRFNVRYCPFITPPPGQHPNMVEEDNGLFRDFCIWLGHNAKAWLGDLLSSKESINGESTAPKPKPTPTALIIDLLPGMGFSSEIEQVWVKAGLNAPTVHFVAPLGEGFTSM